MADIPDDWRERRLPEAIDFREGPGILARDFREDGVPLVRLAGVTSGSLLDGCNYLDPAMVAEKWSHFRLAQGDTLLSTSASLGRIARVDSSAAGAIPYTGLIRMRPASAEVDQGYVIHLLGAPSFARQVAAMGAGSVMQHFGPSHLRQMTVLVPPIPEQRAIASVLGALDDKIESNRRLWERLHDLLPAFFEACVAHADEWMTIGELGIIVGGGTPKSSEPSYWEPREVAWITPKDMTALGGVPVIERGTRHISRAGLDSSSAKLLPKGAVVYTSRATLGVIAITEAQLATNQGFISLVPDPSFGAAFVYCALAALRDEVNGRANGSTFMEVNKTNFKSVGCPSPADDRLLAFRRRAEPVLDQITAVVRESRTLTAIRDALLPKLISGQIRIPLSDDSEEQLGAAAEGLAITEGIA